MSRARSSGGEAELLRPALLPPCSKVIIVFSHPSSFLVTDKQLLRPSARQLGVKLGDVDPSVVAD